MSEANYYESPGWILQLAGYWGKHILRFDRFNNKPTKISQLTGVEDELLKSRALLGTKGINVIAYDVSKKAINLCPECLKESTYARFLWDFEINQVCPIHGCNLINKCPQCRQTIKWLRPSVVKCRCGFDFRDSFVTKATDNS